MFLGEKPMRQANHFPDDKSEYLSIPWVATMPYTFLQLILAVAAVALAGCATPRFQASYRYEPPMGVEGQTCVKGCDQALVVCRADCQSAWKSCTAQVEAQVEERYAQALEAYAADLSRYHRELELYEWNLWLGWGQGYGGLWYAPWSYRPWLGYYPRPDPPAEQPSRESVRAGLHKAQCNDDCGCQLKYDDCYLGCGGRMIPETRCVADCPAKQ